METIKKFLDLFLHILRPGRNARSAGPNPCRVETKRPAWVPGPVGGRGTSKLFMLLFTALGTGLLGAGYYSYRHYERHYREEVERELCAIADLKVDELTQWRKERMGDGLEFFKNASFSDLVRRFFAQPEDADVQRQLQDWIGKVQTYNRYDQVRLLDAQGVVRMAVPNDQRLVSAAVLQRIPEILQAGQVIMQDFYRHENDQRIYLSVLVPIFEAADGHRPLGVLSLRIDPEIYLYPFIKRWPTPSRTAETLLVRRDGNEVVFLNELRFQTNTILTLRADLDQETSSAAQAALGREGVMEGRDYRGESVVAALRSIPDSPWHLVARMDIAEVCAPLRIRLWETVILIGALLIGIAACLGHIWRHQRVQFYKERCALAEALRASEFRYRRLFESAKDGILILDAETGTIEDMNPFLIELLGCVREASLGKKIWELAPFKGIATSAADFAGLQAKEYIRPEALALETAKGRRIEVDFASHAFLVNQHKVIQGHFRDITEAKRAAAERAQLEAQNQHLQKAESLGRMAGALAHQFNNKLQAVIGNLELALAGVSSRDPKTTASLNEAMHAARQAAKTSGLMLTYLGQAPHENKPLDLAALCLQSLPLLRSSQPVVLETDLATPGPVINSNANQIQQVLTNLVTNAWESGGASRGAVRLSVKTVSARDIPTTHRFPVDWQPLAQTYACLAVVDTGCGIAVTDIEKIFDPFFSRKFIGRGLGLPVVLGILRTHNGAITVDSEPGHGSAFRVYFPVATSITSPPPASATPDAAFEVGGTVLVVDDDAALRKLAATMLTSLGFTVLTAQDGVEAVEVFQQHQSEIRCVLTDLTMPRRNGWETIAALRTLCADLPVIMASGYAVTGMMEGAHPERPQAYLGKPYTLKELRTALGCILPAGKPCGASKRGGTVHEAI